jgi:hypothetical protein
LIAHELTHVVQQNGGAVQRSPLPPQQLGRQPPTETPSASARDLPLQAKGDKTGNRPDSSVEQHPNKTGMPDALKAGVESLSGYSLDDARVHYNSPKPAQLQALAYTQGTEIHVAPGEEEHLPHEAWHVVQQAQGRVKPTMQMKDGVPVNDDEGLEHEADVMGVRVVQMIPDSAQQNGRTLVKNTNNPNIVQRLPMKVNKRRYDYQEIARMKDTISAVSAGVVYPLFDSQDGKIWQFANNTAFYKFMAVLYTSQWNGRTDEVPSGQLIYRKDCGTRPAGAVVINGIVYKSANELLGEDVLAWFEPIKNIIFDNKLLRLVLDPINKWNFENWEEVGAALESWDGTGSYSDTLKKHRDAFRPDSKKDKWDPTTVTVENATEIERIFNNVWEVCGQTATYMISRVHDLMGDVTLEYKKVLGAEDALELIGILNRDVEALTLMNIGNNVVHEFTVEKRPSDQAAILHQGYLGAYNSLWWAGLEESLNSLAKEPKEAISAMRDLYGKGQKIDISKLSANLADFMSAPRINTERAQAAWKRLPFNPLIAPNSEEKPNLEVSVWQVNAPETVLNQLAETLDSREEWVTTAVQKEVLGVYRKILEAKKR